MSRPLRIEYTGALDHVISRGNERKPIYRDEAGFHLVVETPHGNLFVGMRQLNGVMGSQSTVVLKISTWVEKVAYQGQCLALVEWKLGLASNADMNPLICPSV